jgi:hypothetical protein
MPLLFFCLYNDWGCWLWSPRLEAINTVHVVLCRMMLRLSRLGINVLYLDSDMVMLDDPYK